MRNLEPGEIYDQVLAIDMRVVCITITLSNIVLWEWRTAYEL
jgi:hypothetical protein